MTTYNLPENYFKRMEAPFGVGLVKRDGRLTDLFNYRWSIPNNQAYTCYGQYGQVVPFAGHQDKGTSMGSLDWGTTIDYVEDLKIGYVGPKVFVEVGSGKAEDSVLMPHDFFHFRKSFGSYPVASGNTHLEAYTGTMAMLLNDRLFSVVKDDPLKPFAYRPKFGPLFDNKLCVNELKEEARKAETKAFKSAMDSTVIADVGSTLVEIRELASLYSTSMAAFTPLFRVAEREFTVSNVIRILNELSAAWLQVQYGLKPLLGMFVEYRQNLEKRVKRGKLDKTIVKGRAVVPSILSCTEEYFDGYWYYGEAQPGKPLCAFDTRKEGGGLRKIVRCKGRSIYEDSYGTPDRLMFSLNTSVDFSVKAEWLIVTDPAFVLDQFNLNLNLGHVWEATKLSFIVDWFWKVGDFLSQIEAKHYHVISGNASFEYKSEVTSNHGGSASSSHFHRIVSHDPNGHPVINSGLYWEQGQLHYGYAAIEQGTLVSAFNARFGNAMALLTVLGTTLVRARTFAKALPNSHEKRRILQLLNNLG